MEYVTTSSQILGAIIRETRELQGLSQGELADSIGITASVVSRIENGKGALSTDHLRGIARALGCNGSDLLSGAEQLAGYLLQEGVKVDPVESEQPVISLRGREMRSVLALIAVFRNH
jgi:transcriptional regulator with XRE-family HTH domain